MAYLPRLIACLLLCVSLNSLASTTSASFNGIIGFLSDPSNTLFSHAISVGDDFSASFQIDSNAAYSPGFDSIFIPLKVYPIDNSSLQMILNFGLTQETQIPSNIDSPADIFIGNDIVWNEDGAQQDASSLLPVPDGDVWGINSVSSPSNLDFTLMFVDSTSTAISNEDFFIYDLLSGWDFAYFNIGQATLPYNVITQGAAVPLRAGIYLFLSGLVGLGLMRGRNG